MKKHNIYTQMALSALRRVSAKLAKDAVKNNYKIPMMENGRIIYGIPKVSGNEQDRNLSEK